MKTNESCSEGSFESPDEGGCLRSVPQTPYGTSASDSISSCHTLQNLFAEKSSCVDLFTDVDHTFHLFAEEGNDSGKANDSRKANDSGKANHSGKVNDSGKANAAEKANFSGKANDAEAALSEKDDAAGLRGGCSSRPVEESATEELHAHRPSSPFVLLDYEKGGGRLCDAGTLDSRIVSLEAEKKNIARELQKLRLAETQRRELLFMELVEKQGNQLPSSPNNIGKESLDGSTVSVGELVSGNKKKSEENISIRSSAEEFVSLNGTKKVKNVKNTDFSDANENSDSYYGTHSEKYEDKDGYSEKEQSTVYSDKQRSTSSERHQTVHSSNEIDRIVLNQTISNGKTVNPPVKSDEDGVTFSSGSPYLESTRRGMESSPVVPLSTAAEMNADHNSKYSKSSGESCKSSLSGSALSSSLPYFVGSPIAGGYLTRIAVGNTSTFAFVFNADDAAQCEAFHKAECDLLHREHAIIAQLEELRCSHLARGVFYWQSDESASFCAQCAKTFSLTVRKHHCRRCGVLLCNDCCSQVGRDMHAPQTLRCSDMEEGLEVDEDDDDDDGGVGKDEEEDADDNEGEGEEEEEEIDSVKGASGRLRPDAFYPEQREWMFDTCELVEPLQTPPAPPAPPAFPASPASASASAPAPHSASASAPPPVQPRRRSEKKRGRLQVRSAPWCRICNRCYLVCRRARDRQQYSRFLEDGRRSFHVLTEEEQSVMNFGTTWEMRCAQLDVLKHVVMERSVNTAHEQLRYLRGVLFSSFAEWGSAALRNLRLYGIKEK